MSRIDDIWEAYYKGQAAAENDDVLSTGVHQTLGHIMGAMLPGGDSDEEIAFEKRYHGEDLELCEECEHVRENCECDIGSDDKFLGAGHSSSNEDDSKGGHSSENTYGSGGDSAYSSGGSYGGKSYPGNGSVSRSGRFSGTNHSSRSDRTKAFVVILFLAVLIFGGIVVTQGLLPGLYWPNETTNKTRSSTQKKSAREWQVTLYGDDGWYDTKITLKKGQWVGVSFASGHAPGFYESVRMQLNGKETDCRGRRSVKFDQTLKLGLAGDGSRLVFGGLFGNYVVADVSVLSN